MENNLEAFQDLIKSVHHSVKTMDIVERAKEDLLFPDRKLHRSQINIRGADHLEKYFLYEHKVLLLKEYFVVFEGKHRVSNQYRAIKQYSKNDFVIHPWLKNSFKRELIMLENLKHSKSILKLLEVIETERSFYLIFEHATPLSSTLRDFLRTSFDIQRMLTQVLIGLSEVNSFGFAMVNFGFDQIFLTSNCFNFKICGFNFVSKYDSKIDSHARKVNTDMICPFTLKRGFIHAATDSYSYGLIVLKTCELVNMTNFPIDFKDKNLVDKVEKSDIEDLKKDLILGLLEPRKICRLKIREVLAHACFNVYIQTDESYKDEILASYRAEFKVNKHGSRTYLGESKVSWGGRSWHPNHEGGLQSSQLTSNRNRKKSRRNSIYSKSTHKGSGGGKDSSKESITEMRRRENFLKAGKRKSKRRKSHHGLGNGKFHPLNKRSNFQTSHRVIRHEASDRTLKGSLGGRVKSSRHVRMDKNRRTGRPTVDSRLKGYKNLEEAEVVQFRRDQEKANKAKKEVGLFSRLFMLMGCYENREAG